MGDVVAGTVQAPPDTYTIRSVGDGVHVIRKVDLSTLPPEAEPVVIPATATAAPPPALSGAGDPPVSPRSIADPPQARSDDGSVIDVLVVYTPAAKWFAGGTAAIETLIDLSVAETNQAYGTATYSSESDWPTSRRSSTRNGGGSTTSLAWSATGTASWTMSTSSATTTRPISWH